MPRYTPERVQKLETDFRLPQDVLDVVEHHYLLAYDDWYKAGQLANMLDEEIQAYCLQIAWSKTSDAMSRNGFETYAEFARQIAASFYGNEMHGADPHFRSALQKINGYMQTHDHTGKPRVR